MHMLHRDMCFRFVRVFPKEVRVSQFHDRSLQQEVCTVPGRSGRQTVMALMCLFRNRLVAGISGWHFLRT